MKKKKNANQKLPVAFFFFFALLFFIKRPKTVREGGFILPAEQICDTGDEIIAGLKVLASQIIQDGIWKKTILCVCVCVCMGQKKKKKRNKK